MANAKGYTPTAKFLHWLIVVLLIAQFIFAWTMPHIGRNTPVTTLDQPAFHLRHYPAQLLPSVRLRMARDA